MKQYQRHRRPCLQVQFRGFREWRRILRDETFFKWWKACRTWNERIRRNFDFSTGIRNILLFHAAIASIVFSAESRGQRHPQTPPVFYPSHQTSERSNLNASSRSGGNFDLAQLLRDLRDTDVGAPPRSRRWLRIGRTESNRVARTIRDVIVATSLLQWLEKVSTWSSLESIV